MRNELPVNLDMLILGELRILTGIGPPKERLGTGLSL